MKYDFLCVIGQIDLNLNIFYSRYLICIVYSFNKEYLLDELLFGKALCTLIQGRSQILFLEFKAGRENRANPSYIMICHIYFKKWHIVTNIYISGIFKIPFYTLRIR